MKNTMFDLIVQSQPLKLSQQKPLINIIVTTNRSLLRKHYNEIIL